MFMPTDQDTVRPVLAGGGTSKGLYLHEHDIPPAGPERDALPCRLVGSPDVLQIDGLGGSRPVISKLAIVRSSAAGPRLGAGWWTLPSLIHENVK